MAREYRNDLAVLLDFLKRNRGFDFTGYKPGSLTRRINRRMQAAEIKTYSDYIEYLEVNPEEVIYLFNTIMINVTDFFRDPDAWKVISDTVIPRILENKKLDEPIRVWSTGCASGEEAYTIAMLLSEAVGEVQFLERVKIYATDVDEEALIKARLASYSEKEVQNIPSDLLHKYFIRMGPDYSFAKDLRRILIFGRNDLIQDAPISRIDLLICRNTLMYFNSETQSKILARLHFALNNTGFLMLGRAEMLLTHLNTFAPLDVKQRIFYKVPRVNPRKRSKLITPSETDDTVNPLFTMVRMRDAMFETGTQAQVVVDANNMLVLANERARELFGINPKDIGRPFQDLEMSFSPVELRSLIQQATSQRLPIPNKGVEWFGKTGEVHFYNVCIQPLPGNGNVVTGVSILFEDVTLQKHVERQLEESTNALGTAMEEL